MTGRVDELVARGVEARHFIDPEIRAVFETCSKHHQVWRAPMSVDAVRRQHPEFRPVPVTDELGYLIDEFSVDRGMKFGEKTVMDMADIIAMAEEGREGFAKSDVPDLLMDRMRTYLAQMPTSNFSRYSDMDKRVDYVREQQDKGLLPGIKLGIPQVDEWVFAVRDTEVVVFCGFGGKGKTTNLVRCAADAYGQGEDVLMVSLEMEKGEVWEIFDSLAARMSRTALARRQLGKEDYGRYEAMAARVRNAPNDIILLDDADGTPTVDKIAALVEKHKPKVLAIDYLSLLSAGVSGGDNWEKVSIISRQLKQLARTFKIKVYVAAQNNRDAESNGPTEFNIAYSNAIFTDCNVMVGIHQDGEMEKIKKVEQRLIKNRAGAKGPAGKLHALGYGLFEEFLDRDLLTFETWTPTHAWRVKEGL